MSLLGYIDPGGGLPPSAWGAVIASVVGAIGVALVFGRLLLARSGQLARKYWPVALSAVFLLGGGTVVWLMSGEEGSGGGEGENSSSRVIVLGFDGLEPELLRRYMDQGRLPNFSRLAREGVFHELQTTIPPQSPVAWASFITGADPGAHGVYDFIRRDPETYRPELALSGAEGRSVSWRGTPFWEKADCPFTVLRLPLTFPPAKLRGRMLSGMGVWDVRGTQGTYFFYSTRPEGEDARGMIFKLEEAEGGEFASELPGPYYRGEADDVREPFGLRVEGESAEFSLQGTTHRLREGVWSDWIEVEFRMGGVDGRAYPGRGAGEDRRLPAVAGQAQRCACRGQASLRPLPH